MLIETPYKKDDIVTIKLMSGEELVGKFEKKMISKYNFIIH